MQRDRNGFWRDALAIEGSVTPHVAPYVITFGLLAAALCGIASVSERAYQLKIGLDVVPYEAAGAALSLLLVMRTNAGYGRWWEARKLWGGIVNQSRNLVISALSYGPADAVWRDSIARWTAVFSHVSRSSLRGEPPSPEVGALVGQAEAEQIARAEHMPSFVAMKLADLLRDACERAQMDRFAFLQIDKERTLLIDDIGGCERILKTPLPLVYGIKLRRFIVLFLVTLPLALLRQTENWWLIPLITMLVAYPLLALDQIGVELQNPFWKANLSHLPLDEISAGIEANLLALLQAKQAAAG